MFKHILVPLDGSGRAERAIPVAAKLAYASGATITLLRVIDTSPASSPSAAAKPILIQTVSETDIRMAQSYLDSIVASDTLAHIHVETQAIAGLIAPTILTEAATRQIDIIVLCSHGLTGISRWALGSVAEKVARYGGTPTLVLREAGSTPVEEPANTATSVRVLVPLDGSPQSEAALAPAAQLAAALAAPGQGVLHLFHVVKPETQRSAGMNMAKQYLDATTNSFHNGTDSATIANLTLTSSVASSADVAHTIIQEAEHGKEGATDIIAMTAYGNNGPQHWALGSVTERVLHATSLPLFIVQPPVRA